MKSAPLRQILRNRNYVLYSVGNTVSLMGTWIQIIAFGWLTWEMTQSPLWLGIMSAAAIAPTLLGGLLGGQLADRMDRLKLTIITQVVSVILALVMFGLYETGQLTLVAMVIIKALLSAMTALSQPARMALITRLVRPDQLGSAIAFSSMTFNLARFIGPAVAGLIIASVGVGATFLVNAATFGLMTLTILLLKLPRGVTRPHRSSETSHSHRGMAGALRYILGTRGIMVLFGLLGLVVITVRPLSEFFPALATLQFDRGIEAVALLTSCLAGGSILGGLWISSRPLIGQTRITLAASALYAINIAVFLMVPSVMGGAFMLVLAGAFTSIFAISAQTLIQSSTPDDLRGRVLGYWFILTRAGPDIGALTIGLAASLLSLHSALWAGAGLCILATGLAWLSLRQKYDSLETLQAETIIPATE